jgi:REP element-mobilizing transposase RayT
MPPEPLYRAADLHPAYQLRYGWTGWPSSASFPTDLIACLLPELAPEWEKDGLRVLESSLTPQQLQFTLSATPQVGPVTLAARVKGRLQHHCRLRGSPVEFSRKLAVRSVGDPTRTEVESYIREQVSNEDLADERFRERLESLTVVNPEVDLAAPVATNSGRYWYNLHLVLVVDQRYRIGEPSILTRIRDTALAVCSKKGYEVSTLAVLADHLHLALRGAIAQTPEPDRPGAPEQSGLRAGTAAVVAGGVLRRHVRRIRHGCGSAAGLRGRALAVELLHLPHEAAGVEEARGEGVGQALPARHRTASPAARGGRGRSEISR